MRTRGGEGTSSFIQKRYVKTVNEDTVTSPTLLVDLILSSLGPMSYLRKTVKGSSTPAIRCQVASEHFITHN